MNKYTTSMAFLEALQEAGVSYLFSNFGSDHPALIEALAAGEKEEKDLPRVVMCPHEMVAISAAHGYAQVTGKPQAVIVHVECGTQNLGAGLHNAWKGEVPILIFAGKSPYTQEGELLGSRNEFIQWIQDVPDQGGIVRGYMKYINEIQTGLNVKQLVYRSLQISQTTPKGPVYLMGAREVMEEEIPKATDLDIDQWKPVAPAALPPGEVTTIIEDLLKAKNPLVVTSYLGRNKKAVTELVSFCERMAVPILESVPSYMNFPPDNTLHMGYQWNTKKQNEVLENADFILVVNSTVPWIPLKNKPLKEAIVYYIDDNPLKDQTPLWYIPSKQFFAADAETALKQLNEKLEQITLEDDIVVSRRAKVKELNLQKVKAQKEAEQLSDNTMTPEYVLACIRQVSDENTIIINELISSYDVSYQHLNMNQPGSVFTSGGGGLGWNGGAAIGAKLADPSKMVINLTGDGSYIFSVPSAVYWMARKYQTPFLTIIFNNEGWLSPKLSTLGIHPEGVGYQTKQFFTDFTPVSDLSKIAEAAGGAFALKVTQANELTNALKKAIEAVHSGQNAVLDVYLPSVKNYGNK
ncbi:Acetolactate synthase [Lentibacillus sp. JNUCC-1]|uniref:thiamine pyrophosphate-requiring protein n=1 Tax=Lentibacillus sp. JNUCC-1 TaxID=2654513 RepID=UPI0013230C77|nr:thiamine pyrophosphate-requiring protein [Lentibacillus sp. JNUCC-1]MUV38783.1 Acetolactate synthase [Lentibacillus sp. JNUCC-1]